MEREEAFQLLTDDPNALAKWNEFIKNRSKRLNFDLRGILLTGMHFEGINFSEVDLAGANFSGAKLNGSNFSGANLSGALFYGATLWEVDFAAADLSKAIFSGANLSGADFTIANLKSADFNGASLEHAILNDCKAEEADFKNSTFSNTLFVNVDLSRTKNLALAYHDDPSTIGIDTIFLSKGNISEVFLLGCGVPETLIVQLPSIINSMNPIQFYSCFLSHSSADKKFARRLHSRMREEKLRVWFDEFDMRSGKKLYEQIDEAIRVYDKLLIVLSKNSMNSEWVKTEPRKAFKQEIIEGKRKLFPISLVPYDDLRDWECFDADHGKDLAAELREYFIPDFINWKDNDSFEAGFSRLLRDMQDDTSKP